MKAGTKQSALVEFAESKAPRRSIWIEAAVIDDSDHVLLHPISGDQSAFRVAKKAIGQQKATGGSNANGVPLYYVEVDRGAPVVRLNAGSASELLAPSDIEFLLVKKASITIGADGEGTLTFASNTFSCLGNPTVAYKRDLTVKGEIGTDKFEKKYSDEFQVWMPYAILIMGQRGIYIHEGADNLKDNGGPSAGCIHLAPGNATKFYDWVDGPTRIQIASPAG